MFIGNILFSPDTGWNLRRSNPNKGKSLHLFLVSAVDGITGVAWNTTYQNGLCSYLPNEAEMQYQQ